MKGVYVVILLMKCLMTWKYDMSRVGTCKKKDRHGISCHAYPNLHQI